MQRVNESEKAKGMIAKLRAASGSKHKLVIGIAVLSISTPLLVNQLIRVADAISLWSSLKAQSTLSGDVEEALQAVNDEERESIPFCLLFGASLIGVLHSVDLKMTPHRCFYCGRWILATRAKQTRDKSFYYHEECEPK